MVFQNNYNFGSFFGFRTNSNYLVTFINQLKTTWKLFWLNEKTPRISHFWANCEQISLSFGFPWNFSRKGFFASWKNHKNHFFSQNIDRRGLDLRMVKVESRPPRLKIHIQNHLIQYFESISSKYGLHPTRNKYILRSLKSLLGHLMDY